MKKLFAILLTMLSLFSFASCMKENKNSTQPVTQSTFNTSTAFYTTYPITSNSILSSTKQHTTKKVTTQKANPIVEKTTTTSTATTTKPITTKQLITKPTSTTKPITITTTNIVTTKPAITTELITTTEPFTTEPTTVQPTTTQPPTISVTTTQPIVTTTRVDLNVKKEEIAAENKRHNQAIQEINDNYDTLINRNIERINSIKSQYGISYVYDELTCVEKINEINSKISDISWEIIRIEPYKDEPEYRQKYRTLQQQKADLENEKMIYEKMREIINYEEANDSYAYSQQSELESENAIHQINLANIESKYSN